MGRGSVLVTNATLSTPRKLSPTRSTAGICSACPRGECSTGLATRRWRMTDPAHPCRWPPRARRSQPIRAPVAVVPARVHRYRSLRVCHRVRPYEPSSATGNARKPATAITRSRVSRRMSILPCHPSGPGNRAPRGLLPCSSPGRTAPLHRIEQGVFPYQRSAGSSRSPRGGIAQRDSRTEGNGLRRFEDRLLVRASQP